MISYPASLLVLPFAALLGVIFVNATRARRPALRHGGRIAALTLTWISPLATTGPGPAQLTVGLLVGFLGIRMAALGERWRSTSLPPSPGRVLRAMVLPDDLMARAPRAQQAPALLLVTGILLAAVCLALLVAGNAVRLWTWSRAADDLLVLLEVAVGAEGIHLMIVGGAGLFGRSVAGLQEHPLLSSSLGQFWARRWNHLVQSNLDRGFFRPYARRRSFAAGTVAAFGASAVMHVIAVFDPVHLAASAGPSAAVAGFFLLHGGLVIAERRLGLHHQPHGRTRLLLARVRTLALFALLSPLLLDPFANLVHVHGRPRTFPVLRASASELQAHTDVAVVKRPGAPPTAPFPSSPAWSATW